MPKVSVVLPVYNNAVHLSETLASIFEQSFQDFEIICVDDASEDSSLQILDNWRDARVRLYQVPLNCGTYLARNVGITAARGEYIAIMDADDIMHENRLEKQVDYLDQNPGIDLLGSNFFHYDGEKYSKRTQPPDDPRIKARLLFLNGNALHNPTMMIRKNFLDKHNLFYASRIIHEDSELWVNCMKAGATFANLEENLLTYRRHEASSIKRIGPDEAGKTSLRQEMLGLLFPDLAVRECAAIARIMEKGRRISPAEAFAGISAVDKVMRLGHCEMGADLGEVKRILALYRREIVNALQGKSTPGQ